MPAGSFRSVVAAMVAGALLIAGAGITCVMFGGTGSDGAIVIGVGLLAVALLARPVGFLTDRRRGRRARRSAQPPLEQGEAGRS